MLGATRKFVFVLLYDFWMFVALASGALAAGTAAHGGLQRGALRRSAGSGGGAGGAGCVAAQPCYDLLEFVFLGHRCGGTRGHCAIQRRCCHRRDSTVSALSVRLSQAPLTWRRCCRTSWSLAGPFTDATVCMACFYRVQRAFLNRTPAGPAHLEALLPDILAACRARGAAVREGHLTLFRFLPITMTVRAACSVWL